MENESLYDELFVDYVAVTINQKAHKKTPNQHICRQTLSEMINFVNSSNKYDCFAGRLREGIILIDLDDPEAVPHFENLLKALDLHPAIIKTTRGKHFYFRVKNPDKLKSNSNLLNLYGIPYDKKVGGISEKTGKPAYCGIIYQQGKFREVESAPTELSFVPFELTAELYGKNKTDTLTPFYRLAEGSRNDLLFSDYKHRYKRTKATKQQATDCIKLANKLGIMAGEPMSDFEIDQIFRDYDELAEYSGKQGRPKKNGCRADQADAIIDKYKIVRIGGYSDNLNLYRYSEGYYKQFEHDKELRGIIKTEYRDTSKAEKSDIIENIDIEQSINKKRNNDLIAFNNGVLDFASGSLDLMEHSPEHIVTTKIPFDFINDPRKFSYNDPVYKPLIKAIKLWTNNDPDLEQLLYEMAGYCLTSTTKMEKFFILTGIGSNGKSTFLKFLEYVIPAQFRGSLSLKDLQGRFNIAMLENKLCSICADFDEKEFSKEVSGKIKKLTTGDTIKLEQKNKDPHISENMFAKLIFSCNSIPASRDTSIGFTRRIVVIPFDHKFTDAEKDRDLIDKICKPEVASWFLSRAINAYNNMIQQDKPKFTEPEVCVKAMDEWLRNTNSVIEWASIFVEPDNKSENWGKPYDWAHPTKSLKTLYDDYYCNQFCYDEKLHPYSKNNFKSILMSQYDLEYKQVRLQNGSNCWTLIKSAK